MKEMIFQININIIIGIIVGCIIGIVLAVMLVFLCFRKKKNPKIKIDAQFISNLLKDLGTKENIVTAKNINGRVQIEVKDLEKVNLVELKKISTAGVFITNQTIKLLFSYDSKSICQAINEE